LERIPVFLCGVLAILITLAQVAHTIGKGRDFHPLMLAMVFLMAVLGAPTALWSSEWRETAIGVGTVALAILTFIAGFSIGIFLVPLLIAMALVCINHLRVR
jgi:hypothetical protein